MIFPVKGTISQYFGHYRVIPAGAPGMADDKNALSVEPTAYIEYDGAKNPTGAKRAKFQQFAGGVQFSDVHMGVDVVCPIGTPVRAPTDGICIARSSYYTYWQGKKVIGLAVVFKLSNGRILYVDHLSSFVAKEGQRVAAGGVIARTGNSGASYGPHAHVEAWAAQALFFQAVRLNPLRVFA